MRENGCQLYDLNEISEPLGLVNKIFQFRKRLKRMFKRRWRYLINFFSEIIGDKELSSDSISNSALAADLKPGDIVRVKSREEIQKTLTRWNRLKGCAFMEEMWFYCGTTQRVFKRVERFIDERDYRTKKCRNIVILENVICNGTIDFGPCDRSCFFFWRAEWLEKIEGGENEKFSS